MPAIARVMIVDRQGVQSGLSASVQSQGFETVSETVSISPSSVSAKHPDLVVIDNRADRDAGLALTRALKDDPETESMPVVLIDDDMSADRQRAGLEAGATDVIAAPSNDAAFGFRVRALVRLEVMRAELSRRRDIMERFAIDLPPADLDNLAIHGSRLLLLGNGGGNEAEIAKTLGEVFSVDSVSDSVEAMGTVSANRYDAVIAVANDETVDQIVEFCADIRRNVSFFNLPIIAILPPGQLLAAELAHRERVSDVLFSPVSAEDLRQQLLVWIRHWRYREELIKAARETKSLVTIDGLTGLSSHGFFRDYLGDLIKDCARTNKTFAMAVIQVSDVAGINDTYGYSSGDHLLRQVGQIVNQLVRVEDLAARFRGTEFCMLLPQTSAESANLVLNRVRGVIANTDFLVMGCPHAIRPQLKSGLVTYDHDADGKSILERAQASVR